MSIKERRDIEIEEMKRKIIAASMELIERDGYEKLSIRKIASKIEYSPTTIYLYYKDKAEIIHDMSEALYSKVVSGAADVIDDNSVHPIDTQVHRVLKSVITSLCSEPEMAKTIMYSQANTIFTNDNKNSTPTNPGLDMLEQLFTKGIALKKLKENISGTSWMVISAIFGFVMNSIENKLYLLDNFDQLADSFVEILMGGIRQ